MTSDPRLSAILDPLNAPQREAVLHDKGPLCVLAGAGSGKTRVITHRIAHLLHRGYASESILAITFTNKAAGEMKERAQRLCGLASPWISTFHSFCARILRRHIHRLPPYENSFGIYDADDTRSLLKEVLKELDVDPRLWPVRAAQEEIRRIKSTGKSDIEERFGAGFIQGRLIQRIYETYAERLRERNCLDFDDLLLLTVRLFREAPDILDRYREQFQQVLVDEYQDINAVQYEIGKALTSVHKNICITGDPDQSIYRWRGADMTNMLNFEHDFPDARVVRLERNYRSTMNVLHAANSLIAHNVERLPKSLWTDGPDGDPVRVYRLTDDREEAQEVTTLVQQFIDKGISPGDIAVFYRINSLSRAVEQEFIYAGVPYSIVGGIEFFIRKEVKDVLAYLRALDNPRDSENVRRIINVPPRGIGPRTLGKLTRHAAQEGRALLDVILDGQRGLALGKKVAEALDGFGAVYRVLQALRTRPVAELAEATIRNTGYEDYLTEAHGDGARDRVANVWELVNAAAEYDRSHLDGGLTGFLEAVNLYSDVDRWERREDRVSLMTLHSAKGLEFPVVVILGVEEGILPLLHPEDAEGDIEEERRLFYVGITRSRQSLYVTHTAVRSRFGRQRRSIPSRFLAELVPHGTTGTSREAVEIDRETEESLQASRGIEDGPEILGEEDIRDHEDIPDDVEPRTRTEGLRGSSKSKGRKADEDGPIAFEDKAVDDFTDDAWTEDVLPVGARVVHEDYGEGEVVRISGVGQRRRITVAFDEAGDKQFVLGFVRLRRVR